MAMVIPVASSTLRSIAAAPVTPGSVRTFGRTSPEAYTSTQSTKIPRAKMTTPRAMMPTMLLGSAQNLSGEFGLGLGDLRTVRAGPLPGDRLGRTSLDFDLACIDSHGEGIHRARGWTLDDLAVAVIDRAMTGAIE